MYRQIDRYKYVHTHPQTYTYIYKFMCVYMCLYIYIYIYIYNQIWQIDKKKNGAAYIPLWYRFVASWSLVIKIL